MPTFASQQLNLNEGFMMLPMNNQQEQHQMKYDYHMNDSCRRYNTSNVFSNHYNINHHANTMCQEINAVSYPDNLGQLVAERNYMNQLMNARYSTIHSPMFPQQGYISENPVHQTYQDSQHTQTDFLHQQRQFSQSFSNIQGPQFHSKSQPLSSIYQNHKFDSSVLSINARHFGTVDNENNIEYLKNCPQYKKKKESEDMQN